MMWTKLKTYICKPQPNAAGNVPVRSGKSISPCYAQRDLVNRWQGDVYPQSSFEDKAVPSRDVPYWMLANRTCQLVEKRKVRLPHLVFIAVYPIEQFVSSGKNEQSLKNQVSNIISKEEGCLYLPPQEGVLAEHLVADFNLLYSIKLEYCPTAANKLVQLTSPFAEHAFQKFAGYYYKVGYDDEGFKTQAYKDNLVKHIEQKLNISI